MAMPQTDLSGAVVIVERLRKAVEDMEIVCDGQLMKMTISAGAASHGPHSKKMTIVELIDLADHVLYNAKSSGRNRVLTADQNRA